MEVGIAGIQVVVPVTGEAEVVEEVAAQSVEGGCRTGEGQIVEAGQLVRHVESGRGMGADEGGGLVEGDLGVGPGHELPEPGRGLLLVQLDAALARASSQEVALAMSRR